MGEDSRCQNGKWNKKWNKDEAFLPDHFLYRGVVRTVVHVLGSAGGRKQKGQMTDQSLIGVWTLKQ